MHMNLFSMQFQGSDQRACLHGCHKGTTWLSLLHMCVEICDIHKHIDTTYIYNDVAEAS